MNNGIKQSKEKAGFSRIAVILLSIILAFNFLLFLGGVKRSFSRNEPYEYSEFVRMIRYKDYPGLVENVVYNRAKGLTTQKDTTEFEILAAYYQKAILYRACRSTGERDQADELLAEISILEGQFKEPDILDAVSDIRELFLQ